MTQDALKSYLSRLTINLQAHAIDIVPQPPAKDSAASLNTQTARPFAQPKDLLYSEDIAQSQDPFIAVSKADEDGDGNKQIYIVWKTTVHLSRPKIRMQKPAIYFAATASLKHVEPAIQVDNEDAYLGSNAASPMNLLEPFNYDPAFAGRDLYLSASRVTKVAPIAPMAVDFSRALKTSNRKIFQAAPAVLMRTHYTRLPPGSKYPVLASLNLEVTAFAGSKVEIREIQTRLSNGVCETFGNNDLQGPAILSPGDEATWLRRLGSSQAADSQGDTANIHLFEARILGKVLLSEERHATIEVLWKSNVDLGPLPPPPGTRYFASALESRTDYSCSLTH